MEPGNDGSDAEKEQEEQEEEGVQPLGMQAYPDVDSNGVRFAPVGQLCSLCDMCVYDIASNIWCTF
jgi:hypothetical protein